MRTSLHGPGQCLEVILLQNNKIHSWLSTTSVCSSFAIAICANAMMIIIIYFFCFFPNMHLFFAQLEHFLRPAAEFLTHLQGHWDFPFSTYIIILHCAVILLCSSQDVESIKLRLVHILIVFSVVMCIFAAAFRFTIDAIIVKPSRLFVLLIQAA